MSNTNQKVPFHQLKNVLIRFSLQVVNAHVGNLLIDLRSCLASIALFSRLKDLYLFTHSTKYLITTLDIELQVLSAPYLQSTPAANLQVRIKWLNSLDFVVKFESVLHSSGYSGKCCEFFVATENRGQRKCFSCSTEN